MSNKDYIKAKVLIKLYKKTLNDINAFVIALLNDNLSLFKEKINENEYKILLGFVNAFKIVFTDTINKQNDSIKKLNELLEVDSDNENLLLLINSIKEAKENDDTTTTNGTKG